MSADTLDAWSGSESIAESTEPAPPGGAAAATPAIELAGGQRLESFTALVVFEGNGAPVCALYGLRATRAGLEEGRTTIECPDGGLAAAVSAARIRYGAVEDPRRAALATALAGARPVPSRDTPSSGVERISVRVVTEAGTVEGAAAPASWPPVSDEPEPSYPHEPRNLTELYEAVMYPHRYAR